MAVEDYAILQDAILQMLRIGLDAIRQPDNSSLDEKIVMFPVDDDILQRLKLCKESQTLGAWLTEWYNAYKKGVIKTHSHIEILIRLHVPDWIKEKRVDEIKAIDIQKAVYEVKETRTRQEVYNVYTGSFRQAIINGLIASDPTLPLSKPKHIREQGEAMTCVHQAEFLQLIKGHRCEAYFKHLLLTGSRPSEPRRLRIEDIRQDHNQIHIRGTKTDGADRYLPLFDGILDNLGTVTPSRGLYFPFSYDYYQDNFESLHFYKYTLKDFRHTFATRALESGVAMKTLQLWLGHSTYEQTANTYSHVQPLFQLEQAAKFKIDLEPKKS